MPLSCESTRNVNLWKPLSSSQYTQSHIPEAWKYFEHSKIIACHLQFPFKLLYSLECTHNTFVTFRVPSHPYTRQEVWCSITSSSTGIGNSSIEQNCVVFYILKKLPLCENRSQKMYLWPKLSIATSVILES